MPRVGIDVAGGVPESSLEGVCNVVDQRLNIWGSCAWEGCTVCGGHIWRAPPGGGWGEASAQESTMHGRAGTECTQVCARVGGGEGEKSKASGQQWAGGNNAEYAPRRAAPRPAAVRLAQRP